MRRRWKETTGFTLVELIVVIAILGILAGVAVPTYSGYVKKANEAADNQLLMAVNTAFASAGISHGIDVKDSTQVNKDNASLKLNNDKKLDYDQSMLINDAVKDSFVAYMGSDGVFKYFDTFAFVNGAFVGVNVEALMKALQNDVEGTPFDSEETLGAVMSVFDLAGFYFSGNDPMFPGGFSLDGFLADSPKAVREAFNFGKFDLSEDQILKMYHPEYAGWSVEEQEAFRNNPDNRETINTIKGNAYVMRFANDATGRNAATIMTDLTSLMGTLQSPASRSQVVEYYKQNIPNAKENPTDEELESALGITGVFKAADVVAIATSGVKNTSGVSTLGSMYALAAGFFHNTEYYKGSADDIPVLANFADAYMGDDGVMSEANAADFQRYLQEQAEKDIGAYLSAMSYLSTNSFTMNNSGVFANEGLGALMSALGK